MDELLNVKPKAIICDIDKTLLYGSTHDFPSPSYYLNKCVWNICKIFQEKNYALVFITCRPESMREDTHKELSKYFDEFHLYMREGNTQLKDDTDDIIKERIYLGEVAIFFDCRYAMDDKEIVKNMWRRNNIEVLGFYMDLDK